MLIISCGVNKNTVVNTTVPVNTPTKAVDFSNSEIDIVLSTYIYQPSTKTINNPERGFSTEIDLNDPDFLDTYEYGNTLVYTVIRLDEYREKEIPQPFLNQLEDLFSLLRKAGVKIILRFSYNDGPYPFSEPDASLDWILLHIKQLEPLFKENSDVIVWLEAGFVGAWGEWHTSTHGLDTNVEAKATILFALLDALPEDRMILLRYPVDIINNFPEPITKQNAFSGTPQSRVGFHNDCFLASFDDEHTFARDSINTYDEELEYLKISTQYLPVGGESCAYNPPRSDCPTALEEMAFFPF